MTKTLIANNTARVAMTSTLRSEFSVSLVGFNDKDVISVPCGTVTAIVRYWPSESPVAPSTTASASGRNVPA